MSEEQGTDTPEIVIYTQAMCGYCEAARKLLRSKGIDFTEIDVTMDANRRREMIDRSGHRTVPQIFVGDRPIGGYDDMAALDRGAELDALLGTS